MQFNKSLLLPLALAAAVPSAPAWAAGGGAAPTTPQAPAGGGGTAVGQPVKQRPVRRRGRRARRPTITSLSLSAGRLYLDGNSVTVRFRLAGRRSARLSLRLVPRRAGRPATVISLGLRRPGVTHSIRLAGREPLTAGRYDVRIGSSGRAARAGARALLEVRDHRFPLVGPFSFGGDGALFGAGRPGRTHQGQDLIAAEGTPVVAPRAGTIEAVQYQAGGAGHYVVLDGEDEQRDYAFMHLRTGSVVVTEGQRVRTGQRLGEVGSTGRSSGPHLHFEIWSGQWHGDGGRPIDPLPLLRAWAR